MLQFYYRFANALNIQFKAICILFFCVFSLSVSVYGQKYLSCTNNISNFPISKPLMTDSALAPNVFCLGGPLNLKGTFFPQYLGSYQYASTHYAYDTIPYTAYSITGDTLMNMDSSWSKVCPIGFNFCFFGQTYDSLVISPFGIISFYKSLAKTNSLSFIPVNNSLLPNPNLAPLSIYSSLSNFTIGVNSKIHYALIGAFPCRQFVISFDNLKVLGGTCGSSAVASFQIVLNELNQIDFNIVSIPACNGSNNSVFGIQNDVYTKGVQLSTPFSIGNSSLAWRIFPNALDSVVYSTVLFKNGVAIDTATPVIVKNKLVASFNFNINPSLSVDSFKMQTFERHSLGTCNDHPGQSMFGTAVKGIQFYNVPSFIVSDNSQKGFCAGLPCGSSFVSMQVDPPYPPKMKNIEWLDWNGNIVSHDTSLLVDICNLYASPISSYQVNVIDSVGCLSSQTLNIQPLIVGPITNTSTLLDPADCSNKGLGNVFAGAEYMISNDPNPQRTNIIVNWYDAKGNVVSTSQSTGNYNLLNSPPGTYSQELIYWDAGMNGYNVPNADYCSAINNFSILDSTYHSSATQNIKICLGHNLVINGHSYSTTGTYKDTLVNYKGCDSVLTTHLLVTPIVQNQTISLCRGGAYHIGTHTYKNAGVYQDTLVNSSGCDSIVTTKINLYQLSASKNVTICLGHIYTVGNHSYNTSGVYYDTLQSYLGCDSEVITHLTITTIAKVQNLNICQGGHYTIGTHTYALAGQYIDTLITTSGCDSIVTTNLTLSPILKNQTISLCRGGSFSVGTHSYHQAGLYLDTLKANGGCDSFITTQINLYQLSVNQNISICLGHNYTVGLHVYNVSGIYHDTLQGYAGCDSEVITHLTIAPIVKNQNQNICQGGYYSIGTHQYSNAGTYIDTLQTSLGCDSIVTTQLTVTPIVTNQTISLCRGTFFSVGTHTYQQSGLYHDTLKANGGCDSFVNTQINLFQLSVSKNVAICVGHVYTVGTHVYNASGVYHDTLKGYLGCDSEVITHLTVAPINTNQTVNLCFGSSLNVGNHTYNKSGTYHDTLVTTTGCDSFITTIVNVFKIINNQSVNICYGTSLHVGSHIYSKNGIYHDTIKTVAGCDSFINTTLVVTKITHVNTVSLCLGQSYHVGKHIYTKTGVYKDTLKTVAGCDSFITTNLNVIFKNRNQTVSICSGTSYNIGSHHYTVAGLYHDTLKTYLGCDSVVNTNLSFKPTSNTVKTIYRCFGQSYTEGSTIYTISGQYKNVYLNKFGCDSTVTLNLTIDTLHHHTNTVFICRGDSLVYNNHTYDTTGIYKDTLTTFRGCDSVIYTNLRVVDPQYLVQNYAGCVGDTVFVGNKYFVQSGSYDIPMKGYLGCDSLVHLNLSLEHISYTVDINPDSFYLPGEQVLVQIVLKNRNITNITWTSSSSMIQLDSFRAYFQPEGNEYVLIKLQSTAGCKAEEYFTFNRLQLALPTAFTPNGDGENDLFRIRGSEGFNLDVFQIRNRYGNLVFETNDFNLPWDGTFKGVPQPVGTYTYYIHAQPKNSNVKKEWSGTVNLIR